MANSLIYRFLFWASVVLFAISIYLHLGAWTGWVDEISFGKAFLMHVVIFVFFFVGIRRHHVHQRSMAKDGEFKGVNNVFAHAPAWAMWIFKALFVYVFVYFFLVVIFEVGLPAREGMDMLFGFSAHWLLFYYVAVVLLWPLPDRDRHEDMSRYSK